MKLTVSLLSLALVVTTTLGQGINYRGNLSMTARTAVDASGTLAYTAGSNNFAIVDVSNPSAPFLRGQVTPGVPSITGLEVWGNYAYCAGQNNGLVVINITNPDAPSWVTNLGLAGIARDVAVYDTLVAIATGANVTLAGVRDPAHPHILTTYPRTSSWIEFDGASHRVHVGSTSGAFALNVNAQISGDTTYTLTLYDEYGSSSLTPLAFGGNHVNAVNSAVMSVIDATAYTFVGQYTSTASIRAVISAPAYSMIGLSTGVVQYLDQRAATPVFLDGANVPAQVAGLAFAQSGNQALVVAAHASGLAVLDYDALAADPGEHPPIPQELTLSAYPNPFNGLVTLTLSAPQSGPYQLKLFDNLGREILSQKLLISGSITRQVDLSSHSAGYYVARLSGISGETSLPLIYLP